MFLLFSKVIHRFFANIVSYRIKNDNLKFISISDYPPRQTINLIYRKDLFLDPILADLLDIIRDFHKNL